MTFVNQFIGFIVQSYKGKYFISMSIPWIVINLLIKLRAYWKKTIDVILQGQTQENKSSSN